MREVRRGLDEGGKPRLFCGSSIGTGNESPGYVIPPPTGNAPGSSSGRGGRRTALIVTCAVIAMIVLGGAAGILVWILPSGDGLLARIVDVELSRVDGVEVNLEDVPIGEDLVVTVSVKARYGEGGKGQLTVTLLDEAGEEQKKSRFKLRSSEEAQEFEDRFYMVWSEGEYFTIRSELTVSEGEEEKGDRHELEFYVAEGGTAEEDLETALRKAEEKYMEAEEAVILLGGNTGVVVDDLLQRLKDVMALLEAAETLEEIDLAYRECERIIVECENRKSAWEEEQATRDEERKQADERNGQPDRNAEIAACRDAMFDYAWKQMVTTPFYAEPVRIDGFWMNDSCTEAGGTMVGMKTAHTDPENAGNMVTVPISAHKENGRWVAEFVYY